MYNYEPNYDFVPFNEPTFYQQAGKGNLTGYAELKLITLESVYIGSGFSSENNGSFVLETIKDCDNKPIIPASSVKGTVRNICSAISDGCLPKKAPDLPKSASKITKEKYKLKENRNKLMPNNISCKITKNNSSINYNCCIICDMFGIFGSFASRISFTDFLPIKYTYEIRHDVNTPNSPNAYKRDNDYINIAKNKFKGYKFYYTGCRTNKSDKQINVETIKPKSEFIGKVFFKNLTKDELQLLLFACGTNRYINLKIGGFKNDGFGEVACYCEKLVINGKVEENPISWAENYQKDYGKRFKNSIEKLRDIVMKVR